MEISVAGLVFPRDQERLVNFLTSEEWPFHVNLRLTSEKVTTMIEEGLFDGNNHESFWILDPKGETIGFIRLYDLDDIDDGHPLFDLRIRKAYRGQGIGKAAVRWLTNYLFEKHEILERIMGSTRVDNVAMRKTFLACGYVKEGHYRKDWPTTSDERFDTVKYGILREDWQSGVSTPVLWDDGY